MYILAIMSITVVVIITTSGSITIVSLLVFAIRSFVLWSHKFLMKWVPARARVSLQYVGYVACTRVAYLSLSYTGYHMQSRIDDARMHLPSFRTCKKVFQPRSLDCPVSGMAATCLSPSPERASIMCPQCWLRCLGESFCAEVALTAETRWVILSIFSYSLCKHVTMLPNSTTGTYRSWTCTRKAERLHQCNDPKGNEFKNHPGVELRSQKYAGPYVPKQRACLKDQMQHKIRAVYHILYDNPGKVCAP